MADTLLDRRLALDQAAARHRERAVRERERLLPAEERTGDELPLHLLRAEQGQKCRADDNVYLQLLFLYPDGDRPETGQPDVLAASRLPRCGHDRHFVSDGLHHDTFTIYY